MPTLSYRMIATQFSKQQWNKAIFPAIRATCNAAGIVKNFPHAILYRSLVYLGIGVKNLFFLQGIIYIIMFLNEAACNSSTDELVRFNAEFFRVEIGVPFSLTATKYNEKTYASYMPSGWYKNLWKFMLNPLFKLNITEDYDDIPLIRKEDEYLMIAFIEGGFRNVDLKALNFVRKFLQAVNLADISTADGARISIQAYDVVSGNGLMKGIKWLQTPTKEEMPASFITL